MALCCAAEHHAGLKPMSPDYDQPAFITQPLARINLLYDSSYYVNCFALQFAVQNCRSQIAQVEYHIIFSAG